MTWLLSIAGGLFLLFGLLYIGAIIRLVWGQIYRVFFDPNPNKKGK